MALLKTNTTAIAIIGGAILICYLIFAIFIRHLFSPHRHLPLAHQTPIIYRLFHDPTTFEIAAWVRDVPNEGLIRYFGFMNQERILLTDTDAVRRVLLREPYTYNKIHSLAAIQYPAGGTGLTSLMGNPHKVCQTFLDTWRINVNTGRCIGDTQLQLSEALLRDDCIHQYGDRPNAVPIS